MEKYVFNEPLSIYYVEGAYEVVLSDEKTIIGRVTRNARGIYTPKADFPRFEPKPFRTLLGAAYSLLSAYYEATVET